MTQGSILELLLFLICINDLHLVIQSSLVLTQILANWLKTAKIPLNICKIELVLFISPKKQVGSDLKFILDGKQLYGTDSVEYLGISEAALQRCSYKEVFCKHAENLQENTHAKVWFQ